MEDKFLKDRFAAFQPRLSSAEDFTSQLERRIEAIESVREYVESRHRHYRQLLMVAFVVGLMAGVGAMIYLATNPVVVSRLISILSWEWDDVPAINVVDFLPVVTLIILASVVAMVPFLSRR